MVEEQAGILGANTVATHIISGKNQQRGGNAFEAAILKERQKIKQEPQVAMMMGSETIVDVAHGMILPPWRTKSIPWRTKSMTPDGLIGSFLWILPW
jgi:hypothetical protein